MLAGMFMNFPGIFIRMLPMIAFGLYFSVLMQQSVASMIILGLILLLSAPIIGSTMIVVAFRAGLMAQGLTSVASIPNLIRTVFKVLFNQLLASNLLTFIITFAIVFASFHLFSTTFITLPASVDAEVYMDFAEKLENTIRNDPSQYAGVIAFLLSFFVALGIGYCVSFMLFGVSVAATCANAAVSGTHHEAYWGVGKKPWALLMVFIFTNIVSVIFYMLLNVVFTLLLTLALSQNLGHEFFFPLLFIKEILAISFYFSLLAAGAIQAYKSALRDEEDLRQAIQAATFTPVDKDELRALRLSRMQDD